MRRVRSWAVSSAVVVLLGQASAAREPLDRRSLHLEAPGLFVQLDNMESFDDHPWVRLQDASYRAGGIYFRRQRIDRRRTTLYRASGTLRARFRGTTLLSFRLRVGRQTAEYMQIALDGVRVLKYTERNVVAAWIE